MKTKILLRAALLSAMLISCTMVFSQDATAEKIISFVDANIGKKVAGGGCFDLVTKAHGDVHWYEKKWKKKAIYRVRMGSPKPGDIIEFTNAVFCKRNDGVEYRLPSHVGIVYQVLENGNIVYADNWGSGATVVLNTMNYKAVKKGKIAFYRC